MSNGFSEQALLQGGFDVLVEVGHEVVAHFFSHDLGGRLNQFEVTLKLHAPQRIPDLYEQVLERVEGRAERRYLQYFKSPAFGCGHERSFGPFPDRIVQYHEFPLDLAAPERLLDQSFDYCFVLDLLSPPLDELALYSSKSVHDSENEQTFPFEVDHGVGEDLSLESPDAVAAHEAVDCHFVYEAHLVAFLQAAY